MACALTSGKLNSWVLVIAYSDELKTFSTACCKPLVKSDIVWILWLRTTGVKKSDALRWGDLVHPAKTSSSALQVTLSTAPRAISPLRVSAKSVRSMLTASDAAMHDNSVLGGKHTG